MIALAFASSSSLVLLVGLAATAAAIVLIAHWGAYRPQVKRMIAAGLIAALLCVIAAPAVRADDGEFVILNPCTYYEPWSVPWVLAGCWIPLPRRKRRLPLVRRPR